MYNKLYLALNMINKVLRHRLQLLTALIVGIAFLYVGCEKDKSYTYVDPCADIECLNGGICLDGTCQCPLGFEGKNCEYSWMERYVGEWNITETVIQSNLGGGQVGESKSYTVMINPDSGSSTRFIINGLRGDPSYNVPCIIGRNNQGYTTEPTSFIFVSNYPIGATGQVLKEGKGEFSGASKVLNGIYILNSAPGQTVHFTARHVK